MLVWSGSNWLGLAFLGLRKLGLFWFGRDGAVAAAAAAVAAAFVAFFPSPREEPEIMQRFFRGYAAIMSIY